MVDRLNNINRLETVSTGYTVFETNQILTSEQLNTLSTFLGEQIRQTRIALLGVGIAGGLQVGLSGGGVSISRGAGVSTDGDLLLLQSNAKFTRFRPYDASAPVYAPLYGADGQMRSVFELVGDEVQDDTATPLSAFPANLAEMVVVMLRESCEQDHDLCSGTDCDNVGKTARETTRFLLVARTDAAALEAAVTLVSDAAAGLKEIVAARATIRQGLSTAAAFSAEYSGVCQIIREALDDAFKTLHQSVPGITGSLFGGDPASRWGRRLNELQGSFSGGRGIQYFYDFLKDVVETWNELRETLLQADSLLCPDPRAFSKHLLLGDLSDPQRFRTRLYRSPLTGAGQEWLDHGLFLARKIDTLITTFRLPESDGASIQVTPSRNESVCLEERAIPYYYAVDSAAPIQHHWNWRLARRGSGVDNLGYRAREYGGTRVNPLSTQIGRYDFFRVEGHLAKSVTTAKRTLEKLIVTLNLPFRVQAVLLGASRDAVVVKPPIRYGDLHRLHQLLRADVATRLNESADFNGQLKARVETALSKNEFTDQGISVITANSSSKVTTAIEGVRPALTAKNYASYRSNPAWKESYRGVVNASTEFKSALGNVVRTDVATPFDSVAISTQPAWIDWLDTLIDAKNAAEDQKLVFSTFLAEHPAFEHCGGVPRGGTLVLVYDDSGRVIGDGALPYDWCDVAEDQPEEPVLPPPVFRTPLPIDNSIRIKPPLEEFVGTRIKQFQAEIEPVFNAKVDLQKDYFRFFKESVSALGEVVAPKTGTRAGLATVYADDLLGVTMDDVATKTEQIDRLRNFLARSDLSDVQRKTGLTQLAALQSDLSRSIVNATAYINSAGIDVSTAADGGKALAVIANSSVKVSDGAAREQLQKGLKEVAGQSRGAQQVALGNLLQSTGLR